MVQAGLPVRHSVASRAWGCSVSDIAGNCFEASETEVADFVNCAAACLGGSAGETSEGDTEQYPQSPAAVEAAGFGGPAGARFADVRSAWVASCSVKVSAWNCERVLHSVEKVEGSEPFVEDCPGYVEGG